MGNENTHMVKAYKDLQSITVCPVCSNHLHPDTVMCINGHVICKGCQRGQKVCPTCKKDFVAVEQLTFVKKVVEILPHRCRHEGCKEVVEGSDHEMMYCRYRPIKCRVPSCKWEGPRYSLVDHLNYGLHEDVFSLLCAYPYRSKSRFDVAKNFLGTLFISYEDNIDFWVTLNYNPIGETTFTFFPTFDRKPKSDVIKISAFFIPESHGREVFELTMNIDEQKCQNKSITVPSTLVQLSFQGKCWYKFDFDFVK